MFKDKIMDSDLDELLDVDLEGPAILLNDDDYLMLEEEDTHDGNGWHDEDEGLKTFYLVDLGKTLNIEVVHDVKVLGEGSMILWQQYQDLSNKTRDDGRRGVKYYSKLCDVIFGHVIYKLNTCLFIFFLKNVYISTFPNQERPNRKTTKTEEELLMTLEWKNQLKVIIMRFKFIAGRLISHPFIVITYFITDPIEPKHYTKIAC